ncbi:MAG: hypothetical protein HOE14_10910 [Gemmatimonadales bacterium]|nr:hypothetical protein [Gemmatimonadales bacterium]
MVGEVAEIAVLAGFVSFGFVECTGVYNPVFDGRHADTVAIRPAYRLSHLAESMLSLAETYD